MGGAHPCTFMSLPFWPGVPLLQSQLQWDGGAGRVGVGNVQSLGQLGSQVTSCTAGKKSLVSRVGFDYSSLAVLSLLARGLFRAGTF